MSEFVSRKGRTKLVKLLLNSGWSKPQLAKTLGITRQAIHLWLKREKTHPCNLNLAQLIALALETNRRSTLEILRGELNTFQKLFSELSNETQTNPWLTGTREDTAPDTRK
jgi:DNA-binding XRE family transcriptional regulator